LKHLNNGKQYEKEIKIRFLHYQLYSIKNGKKNLNIFYEIKRKVSYNWSLIYSIYYLFIISL